VDRAESHDIEAFVFNAFVPAYDFSQAVSAVQGVRIENDYKAWYELMRRFNHMFGLGIDLSDLDRRRKNSRCPSTPRSLNWKRRFPRSMFAATWKTSPRSLRRSDSCPGRRVGT